MDLLFNLITGYQIVEIMIVLFGYKWNSLLHCHQSNNLLTLIITIFVLLLNHFKSFRIEITCLFSELKTFAEEVETYFNNSFTIILKLSIFF